MVTVHGINTEGDWQQRVEQVFYPHFECIAIKYPELRQFGALRLAFGSVLLFLLLALLLASGVVVFFFWKFELSLLLLMSFVITSVLAFLWAKRTRSRVLREFKAQLDAQIPMGVPAHLIAHSYGTFLTGHALKKFPSLRVDRIVLVGCVLPRRFGWQKVLTSNPRAFKQLRNEIAGRDWIPRLAEFGRFLLLPGFGSAGIFGFSESNGSIHTVQDPNGTCAFCSGPDESAIVHNVVFPEYEHSDHFVGVGHAEAYWLPYLWNIDPCEFRDFLQWCSLAATLEAENDWPKLAIVESELRQRKWAWAGMTLEQCVEQQLRLMIDGFDDEEVADLVSRSVRLVWQAISMADEEQHRDDKNPVRAKRLYPRAAVTAACKVIVLGLEEN